VPTPSSSVITFSLVLSNAYCIYGGGGGGGAYIKARMKPLITGIVHCRRASWLEAAGRATLAWAVALYPFPAAG